MALGCNLDKVVLQNKNHGFEKSLAGWSTYIAPSMAADAIIKTVHSEGAKKGQHHLFMRLPANAKDNQSHFIHIGQYLDLKKQKRYRFSVDVKWANPENTLPSAIISIWAKGSDATYFGKDVWIDKGDGFKHFEFEFMPQENEKVFCYLSLLTHQEDYDATDIYVDEFKIEEMGLVFVEADPRPAYKNLLKNTTFDEGLKHWLTTSNNPHRVDHLNSYVLKEVGNPKLRFELPAASDSDYLNNTWAGVYQNLKLYAGNNYQLKVMIDRVVPDSTQYPTIVNIYAYKPKSDLSDSRWLGSVDYKFNKAEPHLYSKRLTPLETADYHIVLRIFGWGNNGNPFKLNIDNIKVERIE
ncbi:hypothetical protein BST83_11390 [Polaribacter filamentus]|uniref:Uncharacterized protein n=2 Tax=Polaribacter filamentus TaxID=53483 RepID=A0A2S7KYW3_9FLAO|nr:hypothetical protein BST83_11390 [Polaribacter filamentus]